MAQRFSLHLMLLFSCSIVYADEQRQTLDSLVIQGHQSNLIGESLSASEGLISAKEIALRPMLRTGEVLEFVPGMVVTQHSGSGKANQYFLRGFNLDHGTDFRTTIDGMPVNMRTHGHGQGYTDLSFIIPEFVDFITYQKGPYHAANGDFSTAGAANFELTSHIKPFAKIEVGEDQYFRTVLGGSVGSDDNRLNFGLETHQYNGPWTDIEEDVEKYNALARWTAAIGTSDVSVSFLAYENHWNSADQIPKRAVDQNLISRLGSLDDQVGGESYRYSLSAQWQNKGWLANAYVIRSELDLFSNFTYFLDDPVNGDQFEQVDSRMIYGGSLEHKMTSHIGNHHLRQHFGVQYRYDDIDDVALYRTASRKRLSTVRQDEVDEYSIGLFWQGEFDLNDRWTATLGTRYDYIDADVDSNLSVNSGEDSDNLASLKFGLNYQHSDQLEFYSNAGQSFHSNDARGATITIDPASGDPAESVDLLVRGKGAEIGFRYHDSEHFNLSAALWTLELDSELLFVGDAGNTEANRPSRRSGIEIAAYYWLNDVLSTDLELSWTRSRFTRGEVGEGNRIEGSLPFVASIGLHYQPTSVWDMNVRLRHFGERTLDSFNKERSSSLTVVNFGSHYKVQNVTLGVDVLNIFDSEDHDIDYLYESRLPGEAAAGLTDRHFHPIEPRTVRLSMNYAF